MHKLFKSRVAAVATGAMVVVGLGATGATAAGLVGSEDIRNGSIQSQDIDNNSLQAEDIHRNSIGAAELAPRSVTSRVLENGAVDWEDLSDAAKNQLDSSGQVNGLRQQVDGLNTEVAGLQTQVGALPGDVFGQLAAKNANNPGVRVTLQDIGGSVLNKTVGEGATELTTIDLQAGTYLISAYGHFDRLGDTEPGYLTPTTDTYGALVLWTGAADAGFTAFDQAAGTYFTGAISPKGFVEATASGSQVLTLTEPTTLHVGGFGYNEDRSGFGSGTGQFSAIATVSAVKVG